MLTSVTRRRLLGTAAAGALLTRRAQAAARTLNVLCHRVHQNCLTTGAAGDLTGEWRAANQAELAFATFDTDPLQDRLFREASLDATDFGVGYLVNSRATRNSARLLQPLDQFQAS